MTGKRALYRRKPCTKTPCSVLYLVGIYKKEERHIGVWGQRHAKYLKQNHKVLYMNLFTSGKLNSHLADVDEQAQEMFSQLVNQMAEREGVTEQLKLENQMKWVARMKNIQSRAAEIVNHDIIYN